MKHPHRVRTVIVTVTAAVLVMTGCVYSGGIMPNPGDDVLSPPNGLSTKTDAELRQEVLTQTTDLVNLLGGEWLDQGVPPEVFDPNSWSPWFPDPCDMDGIAEQYSILISQWPETGIELDPFPPVAKVRAYWEGLGYNIRQIGPPPKTPQWGTRSMSTSPTTPDWNSSPAPKS